MLTNLLTRLLTAALIATALHAQPVPVLGDWQGTLNAGPMKLRVAFHIKPNAANGLTATLDSMDQNAMGIPVQDATYTGRKLTMKLAALNAVFEGSLNAQGTEIEGTFTQGSALPLTLRRQETVAAARRPQTPKAPFPYQAVDVSFESAGTRLAGTLTIPRGEGPFPSAILITGSGPQDRDETLFGHKPFWVIADALSRSGIAVLRLDDRGVGGSEKSTGDLTMDGMASDVLAAVRFLKSRREVDPKCIGVIGHSEGGLVGPLAATRSTDISFVVMLAGPGVKGADLLRKQAELVGKAAGSAGDAMAFERRIQNIIFGVLETEPDPALARQKMRDEYLRFRSGLPEQAQKLVNTPDIDAKLDSEFRKATSSEIRLLILSNPREVLKQVKVPVLALNGSRDIQVQPEQNLPAIAAALAEGGNPDYTVTVMPGLNHLFQSCRQCSIAEYGELEETVAPAVLKVMTDWILRHTRP